MARYYGHPIKREREGTPTSYVAKVHDESNKEKPIIRLPERHDVSNHAPDIAWGPIMVGSRISNAQVPGAAQLAIAILCHALNNDGRALKLHQRFKMRVMGKWAADQAWSMTTEEIIAVCDKIEADEPDAAQLRAMAGSDVAVGDREPAQGLASEITSAGHRNEIPGEKFVATSDKTPAIDKAAQVKLLRERKFANTTRITASTVQLMVSKAATVARLQATIDATPAAKPKKEKTPWPNSAKKPADSSKRSKSKRTSSARRAKSKRRKGGISTT